MVHYGGETQGQVQGKWVVQRQKPNVLSHSGRESTPNTAISYHSLVILESGS